MELKILMVDMDSKILITQLFNWNYHDAEVIDISPSNLDSIPACASFSLAFHTMYSAYIWKGP